MLVSASMLNYIAELLKCLIVLSLCLLIKWSLKNFPVKIKLSWWRVTMHSWQKYTQNSLGTSKIHTVRRFFNKNVRCSQSLTEEHGQEYIV